MEEKIICAGFGGQGILILGKLFAYAGMSKGLNVSWMPSYGAEVRGGTAHSMIVISEDEISSPKIKNPTSAIVMNNPSFLKFEPKIQSDGLLLINSSLIETKAIRSDITFLNIPATETASKLGEIKVANMVMAGAFCSWSKIIGKQDLFKSLEYVIPKRHHNLIPLNEKAIIEGYNLQALGNKV